MRIMVITHAGGSPMHGPNMRWYYLGQALKHHGIQVEIVSSTVFHKYINPPSIKGEFESENLNGVIYHWIKTFNYKKRGISQVINQLDFIRKIYKAKSFLLDRNPDLVIASSPHPFVVFPAKSIAASAGGKLIFEVRDLWPELIKELGNMHSWHPYVLMNQWAESFAIRHAKLILSVKPGDRDYFLDKYGNTAPDCVYVPNGFLPGTDSSEVPKQLDELRNQYKYIVGYVGAVSRYYGLEDLVRIAAEFQHQEDVGFVIIGGGDKSKEIFDLSKSFKLDNFHMIGQVPRSKVESAMHCFDVCYVGLQDLGVHRYGISCNKIYEYMYCSKPILACYSVGYDPVQQAECGFTIPLGDSVQQAKALRKLLADKPLRTIMGTNGKNYFEKNHNFSSISLLLLKHFKQIRLNI
ncbi:MAG: glycosyltransferase family 4 protein [Pseudomonadota bacterium]|nr:glycosyltransferase family 4 protein [Pseudomonadota bacterium]